MMRKLIPCVTKSRDNLQWFPLLLTRISVGFFFAVSGFNKLFNPATHKVLLDTLIKAGIPLPHINVYFVPGVEFIGGLLLIIGLFTSLTSIVLFIVILVATVTDALGKIPAGLGPLDWFNYFLYLPEVLLGYLLIWLIFYGSGCVGIDRIIHKLYSKNKNLDY